MSPYFIRSRKALYICFTWFDIITSFLIRVAECIYHIPFNIKFYFWKEIIIKTLIKSSKVILTFTALFPVESAVSGSKGEQRP